MSDSSRSRNPSLRWRLLAATLLASALALGLSGVVLNRLFADHVTQQFKAELQVHLDHLTARLGVGPNGAPMLDAQALSDPRMQRPFGGLYGQVQLESSTHSGPHPETQDKEAFLWRSRSLWDQALDMPRDALALGVDHLHTGLSLREQPILALERRVQLVDAADQPAIRLVVAGDLSSVERAADDFRWVLLLSLSVLFVLMAIAAWVQVSVGLSPLSALAKALQRLHEGQVERLEGRFPQEVQGLVEDFNGVLAAQQAAIERSRHWAGNLAHAIKTPLAVLQQAAGSVSAEPNLPWRQLVTEQVDLARRQVDWHLSRARAAGGPARMGQRTPVEPVVAGLLRLFAKVHVDRELQIDHMPSDPALTFAGEEQDLQEMLGNALDNAFKWARSKVHVQALSHGDGRWIQVLIEDDGPGIPESHRDEVLSRGTRLDESVSGSGLGLSIIQELVRAYGGQLQLDPSHLGGLRLTLTLPAKSSVRRIN